MLNFTVQSNQLYLKRNSSVKKVTLLQPRYHSKMAAPIKKCLICFKIIFDISYRSLSSETSQEQYRDEFKLIGIPDLKGPVRLDKKNTHVPP